MVKTIKLSQLYLTAALVLHLAHFMVNDATSP